MSVNMEQLIVNWAETRGIMDKGTVPGQLEKLSEEFNELVQAIEENDKAEIVDAIGDMQVVLIILANMLGYTATACLASAYSEIATRTGHMENGVFVKDE